MSVQRIDSDARRTHGWQARAHVTTDWRLTSFFSDAEHGGSRRARAAALAAETTLKRKAKRLRRQLGL